MPPRNSSARQHQLGVSATTPRTVSASSDPAELSREAPGSPAFADALHVGRPNIGDRKVLAERIDSVLDSRWLSNGPIVEQFEQRVADFVDVSHCIAMCNATIALEIVARALGLHGEVIVPSFTFIATAHALQWQNITPIFCDIDPKTYTLDPRRVEAAITARTTGIVGVHVFGRPCNVEALSEIASRHGLRLIFDAAHAFGCSYQSKMIGGFGDAEVFSFHATKFVNSLEGGAVVTNDGALADSIRFMRNFGFTAYDQVDAVGINGKMNEISAAVGLTNLESLDAFVAVNRDNHAAYRAGLSGLAGISLLKYDDSERSNYQYAVIEINEAIAGISRDDVQSILWRENVLARRYFYPGCHMMEPYRSQAERTVRLPVTEALCKRVLALPTGTAVGGREVAEICRLIRSAVESGK